MHSRISLQLAHHLLRGDVVYMLQAWGEVALAEVTS
jgi:hypothetical protein